VRGERRFVTLASDILYTAIQPPCSGSTRGSAVQLQPANEFPPPRKTRECRGPTPPLPLLNISLDATVYNLYIWKSRVINKPAILKFAAKYPEALVPSLVPLIN
jgi:hypothetical protein